MVVSSRQNLFYCITDCFHRENQSIKKQAFSDAILEKIFSNYSGHPATLMQLNNFWKGKALTILSANDLMATLFPDDVFEIICSQSDYNFSSLACLNSTWHKKIIIHVRKKLSLEIDQFVALLEKNLDKVKFKAFFDVMPKTKCLFNTEISAAKNLSTVRIVFDKFRKSLLNLMTQDLLNEIENLLMGSENSTISTDTRKILIYLNSKFNMQKAPFESTLYKQSIMDLLDTHQFLEALEIPKGILDFLRIRSYRLFLFEILLEKKEFKMAYKILEAIKHDSDEAFTQTGRYEYIIESREKYEKLYSNALANKDLEVALRTAKIPQEIYTVICDENWKSMAGVEKSTIIKKLDLSADREFISHEAVKEYLKQDKWDDALETIQLMTNNEEKKLLLLSIAEGFAHMKMSDKVRKACDLHTECIAPHPLVASILNVVGALFF